ncbi:hypothetical protein PVAP13_9KG115070, partial [Panicum virgatum]
HDTRTGTLSRRRRPRYSAAAQIPQTERASRSAAAGRPLVSPDMAAAAASLSHLLLAPKPKAQPDPPPLRSRRRRPAPAISAAASDLLSPAPSLKSCLAAGASSSSPSPPPSPSSPPCRPAWGTCGKSSIMCPKSRVNDLEMDHR